MPFELIRPYCTLADVLQEAGVGEYEIESKVFLDAINEASRFIESFCGRTFARREFDESNPLLIRRINPGDVFSNDEFILHPSLSPIIQIDALFEDGAELEAWEDYGYDAQTGAFRRINRKERWGKVIEIRGSFGFNGTDSPAPDLPGAIRTACKEIAANLSGHNRREKIGLEGNVISILDKSIPESAYKMLKGWRILP